MHPREIAKRAGEPTYITGKPCKRGHMSPRRTSNHMCIQCGTEVYYIKDRERYRTKNTLYRQYLARQHDAKTNGIPFTIEFDDIEQPTHCPVFGLELEYGWSGKGRRLPNKATLDKVDPKLGYVPGNVFVISWHANSRKRDMNVGELEDIINYIKEKNYGTGI